MPRINPLIWGSRSLLAASLLTVCVSPSYADTAAEGETGLYSYIEADQLEYRVRHGDDAYAWDAQGWIGGDYDKVWLKTRGDGVRDGAVERTEVQLLYSRAVGAFWDLQFGARYDRTPDPARGYAVVGLQGLAPYWLEIDAAAFLSQEGDASARLEAEYEVFFTQRLIAKPTAEFNVALHDVEELGIGSGLNDVELGLRLRYEVIREVAPYIGVSWESKIGPTADMARSNGQGVDDVAFVMGVRCWF